MSHHRLPPIVAHAILLVPLPLANLSPIDRPSYLDWDVYQMFDLSLFALTHIARHRSPRTPLSTPSIRLNHPSLRTLSPTRTRSFTLQPSDSGIIHLTTQKRSKTAQSSRFLGSLPNPQHAYPGQGPLSTSVQLLIGAALRWVDTNVLGITGNPMLGLQHKAKWQQ